MKHGKKYIEAAKQVDRSVQYEPAEAIALAKKTATAKFDETIEVHIRTGCDGVPAIMLIAASKDAAFKSGIFISAISLTLSFEIVATFVLFGAAEPDSPNHNILGGSQNGKESRRIH